MSRIACRLYRAAVAASFVLAGSPALGAGFYLSEVGTPGSLGTAGVANPTNTLGADSAWTNPAGMTGIKETTAVAGLQVVLPKMEFDSSVATAGGDDGGNAGIVSPVPSLFYVRPLSERLRVGFSVTAPLGGGLDYGDSFVGRYSVQSIEVAGIAFTPSIAYQLTERLSIGGGLSIVYTTFDEEIALRQAGFSDGKVKFEGLEDVAYQGILGLTYKLTDRTLVGIVYRSESSVDLEGDIKLENLRIPFSPVRDVEIGWDNPQWLEAGVRYALTDTTFLLANAGWQDWSVFSANTLAVGNAVTAVLDRDWKDTYHAGVAVAHRLGPTSGFSLGFSYESSPVDDEDRTLDLPSDEMWKFSAAYGWEHSAALGFAVGATFYLLGDAGVDQTSQGVRVVGEFDPNMFAFVGGTLRYRF